MYISFVLPWNQREKSFGIVLGDGRGHHRGKILVKHPVHPCCLVAEELIRPGDYILTINGVSIEGWSCDRVSSALGAKEYPFLVLTLRRFLTPHSIPRAADVWPTVKPWGNVLAVAFEDDAKTAAVAAIKIAAAVEADIASAGAAAAGAAAAAGGGGNDDEEGLDDDEEVEKADAVNDQVRDKNLKTGKGYITMLSDEHIKNMLADTSDIVRQNIPHPADWNPDEDGEVDELTDPWGGFNMKRRKNRGIVLETLPYEKLLARPNMADTGCLAPELLQLWANNAARINGKPHLPFRMRGKAREQQHEARAAETEEEAAEDEARRRREEEEAEDVEAGHFAEGGVESTLGGDKSRGDLPDEEDEFNPPVDDDAVDTNDDDEGVLVVVREVSLPEREERKTALKEEGICHGADTMSVPHCHGEDSLYDGSLAIPGLAAINAAVGSELFHEKDVAESQVGGDPTTSKNPTSGSASSSKRTKSGRKKAAAATITPTPKPSTDLSMQQLSDSIYKSAFSLRRVLKGGDRVQLKMARLLRDDEGGRCILLVRSKLKKADGSLVDYTFTVNRWMKIIYDSQNGKGRYIDYKHICVKDTEGVVKFFRSFNVVQINRVWRVDIHRDRRPPCFIGSVQEDEKQNT